MPSPARLSAQRWPATPRSVGRFCAWIERTRAARPDGLIVIRSPVATAPDSTVPVTTVPAPASVNERSTASRKRSAVARARIVRAASNSRSRNSSMPSPVTVETGMISAPSSSVSLQELRDVGRDLRLPRRRREIDLGQRDDAALDAEQIDDGEVLARLRHDAVVGRDHQQHEIDAGGAGQHVVHEFLVPRHVDEAEHGAVRRRQIGKAEIDGNAARLFFLQPVGIDAGERANERGLAVIDMAGGSDDHDAGSGNGAAARRSASAICSAESAARTAWKNCPASGLPPARARASQTKASTGSRVTPAAEVEGRPQHRLAVGVAAFGAAPPPIRRP